MPNKPWINHAWLSQIIFYTIHDRFGFNGLIALRALIISSVFLLLLLLGYRKENFLIVTLLLLAAVFTSEARFLLRPGLFTLLFTAIFIFILNRYRLTKFIYILPAIQLLWVNMHGYFLIGILVILIYSIAETLKKKFKLPFEWNKKNALSDVEYRRLLCVGLLIIAASFINPNSWKGFMYPFTTLFSFTGESSIFFKHIFELKPLIVKHRIFLPYLVIPWLKIVIAVSVLSFLMNFKKLDIGNFVIYIIFLIMALKTNRNLAIFSIVAYATMILNFNDIHTVSRKFIKFKHAEQFLKGFLSIIFIIFMSTSACRNLTDEYYSFEKRKFKRFYFGISSISHPEKAVDFIEKNRIKGNILNDFSSGAYLIWRLFPEKKVFIDGRTELYGPEFFKLYKKAFNNKKALKEVTKKYDINCILVTYVSNLRIPGSVLKFLNEGKGWVLVYVDNSASVFIKNTNENKVIIEKFDVSKSAPDYAFTEIDIEELKRKSIYPYAMIRKAIALERMGFYEQALEEADYALRIKPDCVTAYRIAASSYAGMKDYNTALEKLKKALTYAPRDIELREDIGFIYTKLGEFEKALRHYKTALWLDPSSITSRYLLGKAYIDAGEYEKAVSEFNRAFEGCKKQKGANKEFLSNLFAHTGIAYGRMGRREESRKAFLKSLEINPENEIAKKHMGE